MKCCVPGCQSNYIKEAGYVTAFKFPENAERRDMWLRKIPRNNVTVTGQTVVCVKHFEERTDTFVTSDGLVREIPRQRWKLADDAFPSIFPELPAYLSTPLPSKRKTPAERRTEIATRENLAVADWLSLDRIQNFAEFVSGIATRLTDNLVDWKCYQGTDVVVFYIIDVK
jgi:hypothetical protein